MSTDTSLTERRLKVVMSQPTAYLFCLYPSHRPYWVLFAGLAKHLMLVEEVGVDEHLHHIERQYPFVTVPDMLFVL